MRTIVATLLLLPLLLIVLAGAGIGVCRLAGWDPRYDAMIAAVAVCVIATVLAMVPLVLARNAIQGTVAFAGLASTVVQMMAAVALVALVMKVGVVADLTALTYWLLAFYWVTLAVLVTAAVKLLHKAPVTTTTPTTKAGPEQRSNQATV